MLNDIFTKDALFMDVLKRVLFEIVLPERALQKAGDNYSLACEAIKKVTNLLEYTPLIAMGLSEPALVKQDPNIHYCDGTHRSALIKENLQHMLYDKIVQDWAHELDNIYNNWRFTPEDYDTWQSFREVIHDLPAYMPYRIN